MTTEIIFTDKQPTSSHTKNTTCPYCGVGCGVEATIENDKIVDVKGIADHPANLGRLCVKGSSLHDTQGDHQRILTPRLYGQETSWPEATSAIAKHFTETIEKYGPDSVAFYVSGQILTEDYYIVNKLMKGFIGSANIDTNSRLCMASGSAAHKRAYGEDAMPGCYEDFDSAEVIFIIGANPAYAHPIIHQRIIKAREDNPELKLVVIDPRKTATARDADLHLPLKPGSDAYFYNGLLIYLANNNKLDHHFITHHSQGFEQALMAAQQQFSSLADVATACDLPEADLLASYQLFANNEKVITVFSQGINQSSSGVDKGNAIINCHLATGKISKEGMGPFSITGQPNAMGGREVGGLANQLAAHLYFEDDKEIDLVKRFWQAPNMATQQGLKAVDMFNAVDEGKIKAIWIIATSPVVSMPNANLIKRALKKCPMVVLNECYEGSDTIKYADVILPATTWGEKHGSVTNSDRTISIQRGMVTAPGEARNDWQIVCEVAKKMGFKNAFDYKHSVEIFREHAALSGFENSHPTTVNRSDNDIYRVFDISALAQISNEAYDNFTPTKWPINVNNPYGTQRLYTDNVFTHKSTKANFIAITPRLPFYAPTEHQVIMNTGRIRDQWHTMTRTGRVAKLMTHTDEPYIDVNPKDAKRFNLAANQLAVLSNLDAQYIGRVNITTDQRIGEIFVPINWTDTFSASAVVSALVHPITDQLSGQPEFKHSPVKIKALATHWAGYLLSNQAIKCTQHYWTKIKLAQGYKYILADTNPLLADESMISHLFPQIVDWLVLKDDKKNTLRIAGFVNNNLECFFAASTDLTTTLSSHYLEQQLTEEHSLARRFTLMSGLSNDGRGEVGPMICSCFQVGEKTIKEAINSGQCHSVQLLGESLKCGTNCGSCIPELKTLLNAV